MPHKHIVYDSDPHFSIDPDTRTLKYTSPEKLTIMQGDHNSEVFTFDMPREVDGHDMSKCNKVQVHYINIDSNKSASRSSGIYEITDLQLKEGTDDMLVCSWLISSNATMYAGPLNFILRFACVTESKDASGNTAANVDYVWNTGIFQGVTVTNSLNNSEEITESYVDILMGWYYDLVKAGLDAANKVEEVVDTAVDRAMNKLTVNEYDGPYSEGLVINVYDSYNSSTFEWEKVAIVEGLGTASDDNDIAIPPSYNGYPVMYIAPGALSFNNAPSYLTIRFPKTIRFEYRDTQYGGPSSASSLSEMLAFSGEQPFELTIHIEGMTRIPSYFWDNKYNFATHIVFGTDIEYICSRAFDSNNGCDLYDFSKAASIPRIESGAFSYLATDFETTNYIKVPSFMYNEWIEASTWSNLAEFIYPGTSSNKVLNTDDVANELGDNPNKVVSQKFFTERINSILAILDSLR